ATCYIVLVTLAASAVGCSVGGAEHRDNSGKRPQIGNSGSEPRQGRPGEISGADRRAFLAIATASGEVRARAALIAEGHKERRGGRKAIARARAQLVTAAPRDSQLTALKRRTLRIVKNADRFRNTRTARSLLTATAAIDSGLRRYAKHNP